MDYQNHRESTLAGNGYASSVTWFVNFGKRLTCFYVPAEFPENFRVDI